MKNPYNLSSLEKISIIAIGILTVVLFNTQDDVRIPLAIGTFVFIYLSYKSYTSPTMPKHWTAALIVSGVMSLGTVWMIIIFFR